MDPCCPPHRTGFGNFSYPRPVSNPWTRTALGIVISAVICISAVAAEEQCQNGGRVLDEKDGFRDAKLGMSVAKFSGMVPTEQEQYRTKTVKAFERQSDNLEVFGRTVSHIVYYFFKNKLFLVRLEWSDDAGTAILNGFGEALGCQPHSVSSGPATSSFLRASGKAVSLRAEHSHVANAFFGWLHIERVGAEEAIQSQIRREAATQF